MRIFASDRIKNMMTRLGVPDDMPIENKLVSRSIESAQHRVEGHNFDIRKHLVEYDDVINRHREAIYRRRREILKNSSPLLPDSSGSSNPHPTLSLEGRGESNLRAMIFEMIDQEIAQVINFHTVSTNHQDWNLKEIEQTMNTILPPPVPRRGLGGGQEENREERNLNLESVIKPADERDKGEDAKMRSKLIDHLAGVVKQEYEKIIPGVGDAESIQRLERAVLLNAIDSRWVDHLQAIDNLRTAIGLRGYGQRDPLVEYKREAYRLFQQLLSSIQNEVVYSVFKVALARQVADSPLVKQILGRLGLGGLRFSAPAKEAGDNVQSSGAPSSGGKKVGRNDPCPCGSGKKYKKCHGG